VSNSETKTSVGAAHFIVQSFAIASRFGTYGCLVVVHYLTRLKMAFFMDTLSDLKKPDCHLKVFNPICHIWVRRVATGKTLLPILSGARCEVLADLNCFGVQKPVLSLVSIT